jgi:thiamine monophosphate kinase
MTKKYFITTVSGKSYPLVINHLADDLHETLFYPYGEDLEYVLCVDPNRVWTWQKEEGKNWTTIAGYLDDENIVGGYYITELPWEIKNESGSNGWNEGDR